VASIRPITAEMAPFNGPPVVSAATALMPVTIRAKYSGGPKLSARPASQGAKKERKRTLNVPATQETMAQIPSAAPALPWRASS